MRKFLFPIVIVCVMGLLLFTLLVGVIGLLGFMFSTFPFLIALVGFVLSSVMLFTGFEKFINPLVQLLMLELSDPAKALE